MNDTVASLHFKFEVNGGDFAKAGDASSRVKKILQQIGADQAIIRRVAIACYEAEMNVVIHARHGFVVLDADLEKIIIVVDDEGPGIEDIELAMTPGYSTAPDSVREMGFGAGMGLPNMKSCSNEMEIHSRRDVGTTIRMVFENA
ncbi:MAG: ATP-binding protein [Armatimonadota bacterium]|nr:ATP-binding protein [bacterium]